MRAVLFAAAFAAAVALAACNDASECLPAVSGAAACPEGTYVDAMTTDPICLSSSGLPLCRGGVDAVCYVCTGTDFDDNCLVTSSRGSIECVHSCAKC
jgi:hypothetical protein